MRRAQQIGVYRKVGLGLAAIRALLDQPGGGAAAILERRLVEIDAEVDTLRGHQRAILALLQRSRSFRRNQMITKDKWVAIMRAAGFKRGRTWTGGTRSSRRPRRPSTRSSSSSCTSRAAEIAKIRDHSRQQ